MAHTQAFKSEAASRRCFVKAVLKNFAWFSGKHQCRSLLFMKLQAFIMNHYCKETPAQDFSCELCRIIYNIIILERFKRLLEVVHQVYQPTCAFNNNLFLALWWFCFVFHFSNRLQWETWAVKICFQKIYLRRIDIFSGGLEREHWPEMG